jgi:hypothetical protein
MNYRYWPKLATCLVVLALAACGGGGGSTPAPAPPSTYSIKASVSGLTGAGLGLSVNGSTPIAVSANGDVTLSSGLAAGAAYAVTVDTQPVAPVQLCTVSGGSGTVATADVAISIACMAGTVNTVNAAKVTVTIDDTIPAPAQSTIVNIVSPIDKQKPGSTIYMPLSGIGGESAIAALDTSGNIILAALSIGTQVKLSADSTALFFVRLAMGAMPDPTTAASVDTAIQSTAEYPHLVSLITSNLAANTPASNSTDVYASIDTVFSQLPSSVLQTLGVHVPHAVVHAGVPVAIPALVGPTNIYTTSAAGHVIGAVSITGVTSNGSLTAANTTAISWSIGAQTTSGSPICPAGTSASVGNPDCSVSLARTTLVKQALSTGVSTGIVPSNGDAFNIVLEQTSVSRTSNVIQSVEDIAQTVLDIYTAGQSSQYADCIDKAIGTVLPASEVAGLVVDPSTATLSSYINKVFSVKNIPTLLQTQCTTIALPVLPVGVNPVVDNALSQAMNSFLSGFKNYVLNSFAGGIVGPVLAGVNAFGIPLELSQMYKTWSFAGLTFGVCEGGTPLNIVSCASSVQINPASATVAPDSIFVPTITAYDVNGAPTLLPPAFMYSTSDPTVATVDPVSGAATTLPLASSATSASVTITGLDNNTGLTGQYMLTVAAPGTCMPPAGATTCAVTLYNIPDPAFSGISAPLATVVTVTDNLTGVSSTESYPIGASIYDNVNGPPLNAPACNPLAPGCPPLSVHQAQMCSVDGKWTPSTYNSLVSTQGVFFSNQTGCTGQPRHFDIITGYALTSDGHLTATEEEKGSVDYDCTAYNGTKDKGSDDLLHSVAISLRDGSGSASITGSSQSSGMAGPTAPVSTNTSTSGSESWPAESHVPPQLLNTGIDIVTTNLAAGQSLPQACTVGTP